MSRSQLLGPMVAAVVCLLGASAASGAQLEEPSPDPRNISGVWWTKAYTPSLKPMDGSPVPLTEEGRRAFADNVRAFESRSFENEYAAQGMPTYEEVVHALKQGRPVNQLKMSGHRPQGEDIPKAELIVSNTLHKCAPAGLTRSLAAPYPFRILQVRGQISFLFEMNRAMRHVRMDAQHADPDYWEPSFLGEGVARWEGDTLVVDTVHFNGLTTLDRAGLPHSEELHVVERYRKINGGRELEAIITVEDPFMYSRAWTTRLVFEWRPDVRPSGEWVCDNPQRDVSHLTGVAAPQAAGGGQ